jgi:hypothetical protein
MTGWSTLVAYEVCAIGLKPSKTHTIHVHQLVHVSGLCVEQVMGAMPSMMHVFMNS